MRVKFKLKIPNRFGENVKNLTLQAPPGSPWLKLNNHHGIANDRMFSGPGVLHTTRSVTRYMYVVYAVVERTEELLLRTNSSKPFAFQSPDAVRCADQRRGCSNSTNRISCRCTAAVLHCPQTAMGLFSVWLWRYCNCRGENRILC